MKKLLFLLIILSSLSQGQTTSLKLIDLRDVSVRYPSTGQVLRWRSGKWVNETMSVTGDTGGTSVHSELSNLSYAASGHTGFAPTSHNHTLSNVTDWADTALTLAHLSQVLKNADSVDNATRTFTGATYSLLGHAHTLANISNWGDTTLTLSHAGHGHASTDITDWGTYIDQAVLTTSTPSFAGLTVSNATNGLSLLDASAAYNVKLIASSTTALEASRSLTFDIDNSSRTLKFSGNPTLGDWFDQSVKTTGTPTFSTLALSGSSGNSLALETSGLVYDATNNRVGIGTASPSYQFQNSAPTDALYGNYLTLTSKTSGSATLAVTNVKTSVTADATYSQTAILADATDNPNGGASNRDYHALLGTVRTQIDGAQNSGVLYGLRFSVQHRNTAALTTAVGVLAYSYMDKAGTITTASSYRTAPWFTAGTVTTWNGLDLIAPFGTGGTITNLRGISISDYTAGTNNTLIGVGTLTTGNWGLYINSTKDNYFNGKIGVSVTPDSGITTASTVGANIGRGLKVGGLINNDELVKCTITVGGTVTARTFTVNVRKFDGVAGTNSRYLVHWWVSASEYGVPSEVAGGQTYEISDTQEFGTESTTNINHAYTDASGNLTLTVSNSKSESPLSVYFHIEVQGILYTANGTVNTGPPS